MDIKDLVVDVEYAEKLKSKQDSIFIYTQKYKKVKTIISAFTSDEILCILPNILISNPEELHYGLNITKTRDTTSEYIVGYYRHRLRECFVEFRDIKLSNALAKLLIWCVERDYLKIC